MQANLQIPPLRIPAVPHLRLPFLRPVTAAQQLPSHAATPITPTLKKTPERKIRNCGPTTLTPRRHVTPRNRPSPPWGAAGWALRAGSGAGRGQGGGRTPAPSAPHRTAPRAAGTAPAAAACHCAPQGNIRAPTAPSGTCVHTRIHTYMHIYICTLAHAQRRVMAWATRPAFEADTHTYPQCIRVRTHVYTYSREGGAGEVPRRGTPAPRAGRFPAG